ncbi:MAG: hypothetical protein UR94_C0017G0009 [Parcubacteria group bacterium GW2011_GWA2_36_10]|nr:MAG: hypothetical protein UR94_C0017G0009 [Parcubacteria group bacterium GW2011_GWA2_36_10]
MLDIIIDNLDKSGLILNFVGTLLIAYAFNPVKVDGCGAGMGDGKGHLREFSCLHPIPFWVGFTLLAIGFILQLFN